jgi:hypothetical protein
MPSTRTQARCRRCGLRFTLEEEAGGEIVVHYAVAEWEKGCKRPHLESVAHCILLAADSRDWEGPRPRRRL